MKPNAPRDPWPRLAAAARQVSEPRAETAPYGFATRVAALAFASDRRSRSLLDRFAFRAVGIACLLALASAAINYHRPSAPKPAPTEEQANTDDPLTVLLDA